MRYSDTLTVGELMHRNVVTATRRRQGRSDLCAMVEGRFRHMPVVDAKSRKLLGILSDRDLRNVLVFINDAADGKKSVVGDRQLTVEKVMTRDPMTVDA
jgi:CBS domain-containing protein